jgi:alpha-L-fucosidase 2
MKWKGNRNYVRRIGSCLLLGALTLTSISFSGIAKGGDHLKKSYAKSEGAPALQLRYDEPAVDWESQALPIGNGRIGAMVFGGVGKEKIQVNEETLWSGGPGANASYKGGDNSHSSEKVHTALQNVRQSIQDMVNDFSTNNAAYFDSDGKLVTHNYKDLLSDSAFSKNLNLLKGVKNNFGTYQTLGNIIINDPASGSDEGYRDYVRKSDLNNGMETVHYVWNEITFDREYFVSNPANVLAIKLTADQPGAITKEFSLESEQRKKEIVVDEENGTVTMTGQPSDQKENGLKFAQQIKIIPEGGRICKSSNSALLVEGADSVIVLMGAATNYQVDDSGATYDYFKPGEPLDDVESEIGAAVEKGYDKLRQEHIEDYKNLFDRVTLNLNVSDMPEKMTDDLLSGYGKENTAEEDRYLEMLFFQYGRYLLISSSRENSVLPANLQGIWAQGLAPAWNSDFHTNINLQMNYWLAEQTNLTECHTAVIDYINSLVEKGKVTAQKYYCQQDGSDVRGWVIHHENNIWGNTSPSDWTTAFYFPAAAAWMCQDIWDKYQFNSDREFLAENFDTMLQAALFWVDNLWEDERDGTLVANPSYSPEHGVFSLGCTSDQAIIWELFEEVKLASQVLGKESDSEIKEIAEAQQKLYMPKADRLGGQLAEWKDETTLEVTNSDNHRHQNHVSILHPGTYVAAGRSEWDDKMLEAVRVTLEKRGDGGTGWSKAWKINMWARMQDGDRARKLLGEQLTGSTLANLFDTHPPYQIDGNFGAAAGITEMLLQSQGDYIEPLAALPSGWDTGSVDGIKARGNFEMDFSWENGGISECRITSNSGNPCKIKYNGIGRLNVYDETNKRYVKAEASENTLEFSTTAGAVYVLTNDESLPVVTAPPSALPSASPDNIPSATATPDATGSEILVNNEKKPVKIGSTVEKKSLVYKITSSSAVQLTKVRTSKKSVVIPDRITISGKKYTVTTIANNACSGKKITKVTIGKNIQKIGRKAFANCKKLKTVIFKSVKLKSVGKQAFYKTNQKVRVKLGRKVVKKYRKMLTKGKISSKAKYVAVKLS